MALEVVGAGVGRTGTHSLKLALEQLFGGKCHHMMEMFGNEAQMAGWTAGLEGGGVDWNELLADFRTICDWPGAFVWRELAAANPDALVLLSVRDPEAWYKSASNTIFMGISQQVEALDPWMATVRRALGERFSDAFDDPQKMMDAMVRHNDAVRAEVPPSRLLEWEVTQGWDPICERLGLPVPAEPFPVTNSTKDFREMMGAPPLD